ncbi:MAG TPA: hypothetical protein VMM76_01585 [Pirellulaceae bacterium]|nr:hypothetical protein [Pirellulaceae bacterium]
MTQLHAETYVTVVLLVAILLAANVLPSGRSADQHGWPFHYKQHEWRMPGDITILYPPWPFGDPPVRHFDPVMLTTNVLICLGMLVSSTLGVEHLRRRYGPLRLRFGLGSALLGMSLLCIVFAFVDAHLLLALVLIPYYLSWILIGFVIFACGHYFGYRQRRLSLSEQAD